MDKRHNLGSDSTASIPTNGGSKQSPTQQDIDGSVKKDEEISKNTQVTQAIMKKSREKRGLSLYALVNEISNEFGYSKDVIVKELIKGNVDKKFRIIEKTPYLSMTSYSFSPYGLWFWEAIGTTLASFLLTFVDSGVGTYLRIIFGCALILFLPGYSITQFLYSYREELDDLARITLSVGLSLAILPLVGLLLNFTPFGIRLIPVAAVLCGIAITFLILALNRRYSVYSLAHYAGNVNH
jgi:hypothetical protein